MSSLDTYTGDYMLNDGSKPLLNASKDAEILKQMQDWWNTCQRNRMQYEREWYLNLSFYFGRQWVNWSSPVSTDFGKLIEPAAPSWRVRLVVNQIRPIIRTELSKVTKEKPQAFCVPASTDDDDIAAARAAEAIFEHLMRTLNVNRMIRRTMFWTLLCGTSFMKDWYDEDKVDTDGVKGTISLEPVSPFHFFVPNTQEQELEHQPYVIHVLSKDPDWVEAVYGVKVPPDSDAGAGLLEQKFLSAMGLPKTDKKSFVSVRECWIKPCKKYQKGAVVTFTKDKLLSVIEEWPYKYTDFPFSKFDHIPSGAFYASSVIPDLLPIQRELNRTRSQLLEARNRMSKPQLVAPRGSIDPGKITSEPGLIIQYTPGFAAPIPLPLTNIPQYVTEEINRFKEDLQDISGQHEISKGNVPPGVTAATALSFLGEQDDSKLAPTIASLEEGVEKMGQHMLSHAQEFWTAQRAVKVVGENGQYETFMFSKSDIQSNSDLKIEAGSATPKSLAAKQAFIMELGKMQWISPDRALRYLNMSETGKMYEELQVDSRQAQRENLKMMSGDNTVTVNTWDKHQTHIDEHDNKRKSQDFENAEDQIKQIFEAHVDQHRQLMSSGQGTPIMPGQQVPPPPDGSGAPDDSAPGGMPPSGPGGMPGGAPPGGSIPGGEGPPGGNVVQPNS